MVLFAMSPYHRYGRAFAQPAVGMENGWTCRMPDSLVSAHLMVCNMRMGTSIFTLAHVHAGNFDETWCTGRSALLEVRLCRCGWGGSGIGFGLCVCVCLHVWACW